MKIITIMADWGPYAWLKECEDGTTRVGGSIADAYGFQSSGFWVSPGLEQAFADWIDDFGWRCFDAEPSRAGRPSTSGESNSLAGSKLKLATKPG